MAHMWGRRGAHKVSVGKHKKPHHLKDLDVGGKIILKLISKYVEAWTGFVWLRTGSSYGFCEHGNEPLGTIKCGEFLYRWETVSS